MRTAYITRFAIATALTLALGACGQALMPKELNEYNRLVKDDSAIKRAKRIAPDELTQAKQHHGKAIDACESKDEVPCKHHALMAKILLSTALERAAIAEAEQQESAAQERIAAAQRQTAAQEALKADYDKRIARMERIQELKRNLDATSDKGAAKVAQLKLQVEQRKLAEQRKRAELLETQQRVAEQQAKLDVVMDRNALFESAMQLVGKENVKQTYRGIIVTVRNLFAPGKPDVQDSQKGLVTELAKLAARHAKYPIVVEGHTDSRGSNSANLALSQARAQAVMNELIANKIELARVKAVGFGETKPITDNASKEGREANRRIDIAFLFTSTLDSQP